MANKYENYSKKANAQEGEIVWTYGVNFTSSPEVKPHRHSQNRPYLVLYREESGHFKGLKLTSNIRGYMAEFKLSLAKYGEKKNIKKDTVADLRQLVVIKASEIMKNENTKEFILDDQDISNIYMKMMRLYTINEISLTEEEARIIFEKYIRSRRPQIGTILVVNYCKDYLLVIGEDEENYQCMPLHRYQNSELEERLDIYNSPSYVNYEERFYVPKDTILFIKSFHIKNEILQKIMPKIKKQSTKGFQSLKKDQ